MRGAEVRLGKVPRPQHVGERGQRAGAEAEPRKGQGSGEQGAGSRSEPSGQCSEEVGMEGRREEDKGEQVPPVGPCSRTQTSEVGWEDCGHLWMCSWQATRIFKILVLVSTKIFVYIDVSGTWLI